MGQGYRPPSSLAITSAFPSCYFVRKWPARAMGAGHTPVVKPMELYEFPKEIPIATRWAGSFSALIMGGVVLRTCIYGRGVQDIVRRLCRLRGNKTLLQTCNVGGPEFLRKLNIGPAARKLSWRQGRAACCHCPLSLLLSTSRDV